MENNMNNNNEGEIILYQPNQDIRLEVRIAEETVWLSQAQMAELFGTQRQAITKHLKNIFDSQELTRESTSSVLELLRQEGNRYVPLILIKKVIWKFLSVLPILEKSLMKQQ